MCRTMSNDNLINAPCPDKHLEVMASSSSDQPGGSGDTYDPSLPGLHTDKCRTGALAPSTTFLQRHSKVRRLRPFVWSFIWETMIRAL